MPQRGAGPAMASPAATFPTHALAPALPLDLPASAHTVYAFLARAGPRTHKDLVAEAGLPARTARFALERLRRTGLVEEVPSLRDARQSYWRARTSA